MDPIDRRLLHKDVADNLPVDHACPAKPEELVMHRRRLFLTTLLALPLAAGHSPNAGAEEGNNGIAALTGAGPREPEPFHWLDTDRNGRIDRREAARNRSLVIQFQELDRDGDGGLNRSEFAGFQELPGPANDREGAIRPKRPTDER